MTDKAPKKKGKIKAYSKDVEAGVINGADGKSYLFRTSDMPPDHQPHDDEDVTFDGEYKDAHNVEIDTGK